MTAATTAQLSRAALNDYIESYFINAARLLSLAEVFRDVYPGQRATDCALLALRKRLQYLAAEGRLHSDGYGDGRTWRGPALRPGAMDFRSCPSVGYRC